MTRSIIRLLLALCALAESEPSFAEPPIPARIDHVDVASFYPLAFADSLGRRVAGLQYDETMLTCHFTGDMTAAAQILYLEFLRVSEERDRLLYGNKQVDEWHREQRKR